MELHFKPLTYEYIDTFRISRESRSHQEALLIGFEKEGIWGWGEMTANAHYSVDVKQAIEVLKSSKDIWSQILIQEPKRNYPVWVEIAKGNSFLCSALDCAYHDWYARYKGIRLCQSIGAPTFSSIDIPFTLGLDEPDEMVRKLFENPWPSYKIKLGGPNDIECIRSLREVSPAPLMIDINEGWSFEYAISHIPSLIQLGISMIEQPLQRADTDKMDILYQRSSVPIFADESFGDLSDLKACLGRFHGINIKLQKVGGITPALEIIKKAQKSGLQIMIGCMTESSVGLSAALALAGYAQFVDLDSSLLIKKDPASGLHYDNGKLFLPETAGNGVTIR